MDLISRKSLYDLIWSKPLVEIQNELDLTYYQLRKICDKFDIPMPENGYWAKLKYGKKVMQMPYFDSPDLPNEISLEGILEPEINEIPSLQELKLLISKDLGVKLKVPEKVIRWHPLILDYLEKRKLTEEDRKRGVWSSLMREAININVYSGQSKRALRIFDTILKVINSRGHHVNVTYGETKVIIGDFKYAIHIRSKNKRIVDESSSTRWPLTKLIPQDILVFKIGTYSCFEFMDTTKVPLEEKIVSIVARLEFEAAKDKRNSLKWELNRIANDEIRAISELEKVEKQLEKEKFEDLVQKAENWKKYKMISEYLDALDTRDNLTDEEIKYVEWGRKKAITLIN
jgi:hypothetical protein